MSAIQLFDLNGEQRFTGTSVGGSQPLEDVLDAGNAAEAEPIRFGVNAPNPDLFTRLSSDGAGNPNDLVNAIALVHRDPALDVVPYGVTAIDMDAYHAAMSAAGYGIFAPISVYAEFKTTLDWYNATPYSLTAAGWFESNVSGSGDISYVRGLVARAKSLKTLVGSVGYELLGLVADGSTATGDKATWQTVYGASLVGQLSGDGAVAELFGVFASANVYGGSAVALSDCVRCLRHHEGSGLVGESNGVDVTAISGAQTVTKGSGVVVRNQGRAATATAYGVQVETQSGSAAMWPFDYAGGLWRVDSAGVMRTQAHAAPSDGSLAAGECAAWFDQTNGSPSLNVKGKQADGTVFSGIVTRLAQVSPKGTIISGALSTVQLVTATGAQILTTRDAETITPCTFNPGVATTATVTVALSPDNVTYSTLGVETEPVGTVFDGTIRLVKVRVPAGWYLKLTVNAQAVLGLTTYY